jgi:hypothetical protein
MTQDGWVGESESQRKERGGTVACPSIEEGGLLKERGGCPSSTSCGGRSGLGVGWKGWRHG